MIWYNDNTLIGARGYGFKFCSHFFAAEVASARFRLDATLQHLVEKKDDGCVYTWRCLECCAICPVHSLFKIKPKKEFLKWLLIFLWFGFLVPILGVLVASVTHWTEHVWRKLIPFAQTRQRLRMISIFQPLLFLVS